ncbi:outer membrane beta-barrel protein [Flavobacterium sp. 3HN19-14]|uniref:outer membrane beta-barrel protein n=1 Tax=Flavobacterium sp. 3HN19-14 TaxID=3448133 RepID=UPI003EE2D3EC
MTRIYLCLVFLFLAFTSSAQSSITIKGKIIEENSKLPLESATIYITSSKDSTIVDYTISGKNGTFQLTTKKIKQPVFLKVSFVGFQDYKQEITELLADKDFGTIAVKESAKDLNEVVVKSEAPPIRIKQDTLEFNASSFKVRDDANVEALLKQLPGVEISPEGKIKVNGKEVNNILVNGKPFFGKDGKIATQNLPSEIIDKVQITDTKTKEEELSGQAASSDTKTINLTIQKDMNKGLFGKFGAGKGSNDRYEASGLINYFKDEQKFSFLGGSNNVNSIGFSMDEIFDSMGGGRNVYMSNDGSFSIDGQQFGSGNGITLSSIVGLNYADTYLKKIETSGSYFYTNAKTSNVFKNRTQRFIAATATEPAKSYISESEGNSDRFSDGHNLNFDIQYKIDSLTTLSIRPKLLKNRAQSKSVSASSATNDIGLVYRSSGDNDSNNNSESFENEMYLNRKFKKKGRSLGVAFNNTNKKSDANSTINSETFYFQDPDKDDDFRHQRANDATKHDEYYSRIGYSEPITDSLSVTIRTAFNWKKNSVDKNTFNRDGLTNQYTTYVDTLSYGLNGKSTNITPSVGLTLRKKKYSFGMTLGSVFTTYKTSQLYKGNTTAMDKNYVYADADGWLNYNIDKSKSAYVYYNYDVELPSVEQLFIVDKTQPLSQILGSADLKPAKRHNIYLNYNNYDWATKSGSYFYGGANFQEQEIIMASKLDEQNLVNVMTYKNIDNTFNVFLGFNLSKSIKKEQHKFTYDFGMNDGYTLSKGLTNNSLFQSKSFYFEPNAHLTYEYGEILTFQPSYNYTYNITHFSNYSIDKSSTFRHVVKAETTVKWNHVVFGNDFGYTYNSNIADGFKKDFYLLNASLGYNFFKDKLLAKVKVYDILNQNTNATRSISPEAITDMQNTVLKRYVMFSLSYKIEKFGGKKKNPWEMGEE